MAWETLHTDRLADNLGITATHVRKIKSGKEYEQYFNKPSGTTDVIMSEATVHDTLAFVGISVNKNLAETKKIAQVLKRETLDKTCHSVFDFFYQNYQYKLDEIGVEQVRRPARAWADRKSGIDCDCFTASVSSVLTNLGIEHYLKIIAINGKPNYQHIYVVVPLQQGLDINKRANYLVIDPVLNNYNEEAPKITQTKHLKMSGIPLHELGGLDEVAGLGNEFDGIDEELNGLNDDALEGVFKKRLHQHIKNTRRKLELNPHSVSRFYKPNVLLAQVKQLDEAMHGTDEHLDKVLEHLSNTEHEAVHPHLTHVYDALHGHDDHVYQQLFGAVDDNMLDAVMGLGKKGRAAKKVAKASTGKKGFFTKVKNARKVVKATKGSGKVKGKLKATIKKVGKIIKKANPVSIAARGGFVVAMRTNFAKLGERAYWGYQTQQFATSKGLSADYYNSCVQLLNRIKTIFVSKLGGNESALKKAIMNGRAAKKIAKLLKQKGMSGTTEELFGLGGLGVVAEASVVSAMAFLTPIMAMASKLFKGKKSGLESETKGKKKMRNGKKVTDTVTNENGTESEGISDDPKEEVTAMQSEASNPSDTTIDNDGSIEAADSANDEEPSDDNSEKKKIGTKPTVATQGKTDVATTSNNTKPKQATTDESTDTTPEKSSNIGLIVGVSAAGLLAIGLLLKGKNSTGVSGLGNFSAKRESKNLKQKLNKQGVKMPHGYQVVKRKIKGVKTIKI